MYNGDLPGVNKGLSVKAHEMDHFSLLLKAFHIVKIRKDRVKALHPGGSRGDYHLLPRARKLNAGKGDVRLEILCIVAPGEGDADEPFAGAAYLVGVYNAHARFECRHE